MARNPFETIPADRGQVEHNIERENICPRCYGTGKDHGEVCGRCEGSGNRR